MKSHPRSFLKSFCAFLAVFVLAQTVLTADARADFQDRLRSSSTLPASYSNSLPSSYFQTKDFLQSIPAYSFNAFLADIRQMMMKRVKAISFNSGDTRRAGTTTWADIFGASNSSTVSSSSFKDAAMASAVSTRFTDGSLNRADMLGIFQQAGLDGTVSAAEYADLQLIQKAASYYKEADYVKNLSDCVVFNTAANATYQGKALGNLSAGSSASVLNNLVNKWFFGADTPGTSYTYQQAAGSLFVDGISYTDIVQGAVGDCYFMASLAEAALKRPDVVSQMFIDNGDNTYTVRFYQNGQADYVTVNKMLPVDSKGRLIYSDMGTYASDTKAELWTALAEKAYVQVTDKWGSRKNAYDAISGGYIAEAMGQITGGLTKLGNALNLSAITSAWNSGAFVGFASKTNPSNWSVVGNHAYAMVNYNPVTLIFTLYNPWGSLLQITWNNLLVNFSYFDTAVVK